MKLIILLFILLLPPSAYSQHELSTLKKVGEDVYISSRIDDLHTINYWFKKCMANNLYTFYRVSLCTDSSSVILNEANSDNIGPFEIKTGGWCGGNHLYKDNKTKTAETVSFKVFVNNNHIKSDTVITSESISIEVINRIYNPISELKNSNNRISFTDTLCIESVKYNICGNSIAVNVFHKYINKIPVTITKYYGMQSMFNNEHSILSPMGEYNFWTDISKIGRFKKKDYPLFNRYIEKSEFGYQSTYLLNNELGTHNQLRNDNDVIFIGNSWSKSYHNLISNSYIIASNNDSWSGIYTWFATPLLNIGSAFSYSGVINGRDAIFFSNNKKGDYYIPLYNLSQNKIPIIIENYSKIIITQHKDYIHFKCNKNIGSAIIVY